MIHLNIIVRGTVQGVFFRKYTNQKANELGLKGYVMNRIDGTVYVEVEGDEENVNQFKEWLQEGSPKSTVFAVEPKEGKVQGFDQFEIRR